VSVFDLLSYASVDREILAVPDWLFGPLIFIKQMGLTSNGVGEMRQFMSMAIRIEK
jgi:hypothetical protein